MVKFSAKMILPSNTKVEIFSFFFGWSNKQFCHMWSGEKISSEITKEKIGR